MKKILLILLMLIPINCYCISARSAIMIDSDNNRILYSKNINEKRSVASISKIMTAVLAIESGKLDEYVLIGDEIDKSYGSGIYIKKGEKIKLKDLVYGLMLRSGNDAANAIAHFVGKDKFISMMNEKAAEIGMKNTTFNNPSGLDEKDGNYSTAYDMAILTSYAMKLMEFQEIVGTKTYYLKTNKNTYYWINKNKLLFTYNYTTGGKTGFTVKARRTLVTTASKNNLNLVVVTLNDGNDFKDHRDLFEYGFNNYTNVKLLNNGILDIKTNDLYNNYKLEILNNFNYPIGNDDKVLINYKLYKEPIVGKTGYIDILLNNNIIHKEIIYGELNGK